MEEKRISISELLQMNLTNEDVNKTYQKLRDWMTGGETFEWSYERDKITGDVILKRW